MQGVTTKALFRFTDEKFSADLLPTVGIDFRVKVFDTQAQLAQNKVMDY